MWRTPRPKIGDDARVVNDVERSRERTMNRALRLLAAKPRSVGELRMRLLEKRWTNEEIVDGVIEKLKEYKYLDDQQFARDLASSKLRQKPQGRLRLKQALLQKQLDSEVIDAALNIAFETIPEDELLDAAIEKRVSAKGVPESPSEIRKLTDHLLRRGFNYGEIREKIRHLKLRDP